MDTLYIVVASIYISSSSTTTLRSITAYSILYSPIFYIAIILAIIYISSSLNIKKRLELEIEGITYIIPIGISINSAFIALIIIFIVRPIRKA